MFGVTPKEIYDLTKAGVIARGLGRLYSVEDTACGGIVIGCEGRWRSTADVRV